MKEKTQTPPPLIPYFLLYIKKYIENLQEIMRIKKKPEVQVNYRWVINALRGITNYKLVQWHNLHIVIMIIANQNICKLTLSLYFCYSKTRID